jgi:hypothetical protein
MPVKLAETSSWWGVVSVGVEVDGGGAGVVVFLDRGIVSPWKGVVGGRVDGGASDETC